MASSQVRRAYPVPLEAVLGAEVAVLDAQLQACWTLQAASVVVAVRAEAFPFGGRLTRVSGHCEIDKKRYQEQTR
jgi:hypothetical protein